MSMNDSYTFESFIHGYHVFKDRWRAEVGQELTVAHEANNREDKHAIGIYRDGDVMGHAPREYSRVLHFFLNRGGAISVRVTGLKVYRGLGYGLEIPALYTFRGSQKDMKALPSLLKKKH